jgi:hypothetical protein
VPPTPEEVRELFRVHYSPQAKAERERRALALDTTRTWVDPNGYRLSDRLWFARQDIRNQVDDVIRTAIREGTDALVVARVLESYLLPENRPLRSPAGRLIRNQAASVVTAFPDARNLLASKTPSKGSYPARRLMRTEITRAHGQAAIWAAERNPLNRGVKWALSGAHPKTDICDQHAHADRHNLGPGIYPPRSVPRYPSHPHDLCVLSPYSERDPAKRRENILALRREMGLATPLPNAPEIPWVPVMSEAEARTWARSFGGTYADDTFYHFTREAGAEGIMQEGFRQADGVLGELNYLTRSPNTVGIGRARIDKRLDVVTRISNPFVGTSSEWNAFLNRSGIMRLEGEAFRVAIRAEGYDGVIIKKTNGPDWLLTLDKDDTVVFDRHDFEITGDE